MWIGLCMDSLLWCVIPVLLGNPLAVGVGSRACWGWSSSRMSNVEASREQGVWAAGFVSWSWNQNSLALEPSHCPWPSSSLGLVSALICKMQGVKLTSWVLIRIKWAGVWFYLLTWMLLCSDSLIMSKNLKILFIRSLRVFWYVPLVLCVKCYGEKK